MKTCSLLYIIQISLSCCRDRFKLHFSRKMRSICQAIHFSPNPKNTMLPFPLLLVLTERKPIAFQIKGQWHIVATKYRERGRVDEKADINLLPSEGASRHIKVAKKKKPGFFLLSLFFPRPCVFPFSTYLRLLLDKN